MSVRGLDNRILYHIYVNGELVARITRPKGWSKRENISAEEELRQQITVEGMALIEPQLPIIDLKE